MEGLTTEVQHGMLFPNKFATTLLLEEGVDLKETHELSKLPSSLLSNKLNEPQTPFSPFPYRSVPDCSQEVTSEVTTWNVIP